MTRTYTHSTTQVWASGQENYDFAKLFSPDGTSGSSGSAGVYYSHVITVDNNFLRLMAFNLVSGETVTIEQIGGDGSGQFIIDYCPVNGPVQLTSTNTTYIIERAGRYRLRLNGDITTAKVSGFRFAMENESFEDIVDAFRVLAGKASIKLVLCQ